MSESDVLVMCVILDGEDPGSNISERRKII